MPKFGVTMTWSESAYVEVEAVDEDAAIELAASMDDSDYQPMGGGDEPEYEAEEL